MTPILRDFAARFTDARNEPALRHGELIVSGRDFWDDVHRRAAVLRERGVSRADRVALFMRKHPEAVSWLFAALLCGAIAVPIDRRSPAPRISALLASLDPVLALFDESSFTRFEKSGARLPDAGKIIHADAIDEAAAPSLEPFVGPELTADDPALILMTSGTTGDPKGITLSHGNLAAFSDWAIVTFALGPDDRFLNIAPLHFDLSLLDVLTALRIGAQVTLADEADAMFPARLGGLLEGHGISVLYTVPTILQGMVAKGGLAGRQLPDLRWILFAGEIYPAPALAQLIDAVGGTRLGNLFGPTETNVITWKVVERAPDFDESSNIGVACSHARIALCDAQGAPVAPGESGEICVAGPTVMQGYWACPELTRARYFDGRPGLFRTGDFGFVDAAGDIRFTGRQDRQVKLRGNRVELEAIEARALALPGVAAAAATVSDDGQSLCLHIAAEPGVELSKSGMLRKLVTVSAHHELPEHFIFYAEWPTISSGKSDLGSLRDNHGKLLAEMSDSS